MLQMLRATGKPYHPRCFTCVVCGKNLDGLVFTVDATNQIHCIDDFHRSATYLLTYLLTYVAVYLSYIYVFLPHIRESWNCVKRRSMSNKLVEICVLEMHSPGGSMGSASIKPLCVHTFASCPVCQKCIHQVAAWVQPVSNHSVYIHSLVVQSAKMYFVPKVPMFIGFLTPSNTVRDCLYS